MAREWKLGKDMILDDNILDPITFDELVMTVRCNCSEINEMAVRKTAREILTYKLEDYFDLLERNIKEVIAEVNKQKGVE